MLYNKSFYSYRLCFIDQQSWGGANQEWFKTAFIKLDQDIEQRVFCSVKFC